MHLIENTIQKYSLTFTLKTSFKSQQSNVSCKKEIEWSYGNQFSKYLRINKFKGLSGLIEFNDGSPGRGSLRYHFKFYLFEKLKDSIDLIGIWDENKPAERIQITREFIKQKEAYIKKLNRNLIVATVIV